MKKLKNNKNLAIMITILCACFHGAASSSAGIGASSAGSSPTEIIEIRGNVPPAGIRGFTEEELIDVCYQLKNLQGVLIQGPSGGLYKVSDLKWMGVYSPLLSPGTNNYSAVLSSRLCSSDGDVLDVGVRVGICRSGMYYRTDTDKDRSFQIPLPYDSKLRKLINTYKINKDSEIIQVETIGVKPVTGETPIMPFLFKVPEYLIGAIRELKGVFVELGDDGPIDISQIQWELVEDDQGDIEGKILQSTGSVKYKILIAASGVYCSDGKHFFPVSVSKGSKLEQLIWKARFLELVTSYALEAEEARATQGVSSMSAPQHQSAEKAAPLSQTMPQERKKPEGSVPMQPAEAEQVNAEAGRSFLETEIINAPIQEYDQGIDPKISPVFNNTQLVLDELQKMQGVKFKDEQGNLFDMSAMKWVHWNKPGEEGGRRGEGLVRAAQLISVGTSPAVLAITPCGLFIYTKGNLFQVPLPPEFRLTALLHTERQRITRSIVGQCKTPYDFIRVMGVLDKARDLIDQSGSARPKRIQQ